VRVLSFVLAMLMSLPALAEPLQPREVPPEVFLDRAGMPEFVLQSGLIGLTIGPLLTSTLFKDDVRQSSGLILGPLLGVGLPFLLKHNKPIHVAEAGLYNFMQRLGLLNGFLIPQLWEEDNERIITGVPGLFALAGLGAGIHLFPQSTLTPGQISALSSGIAFGGATGLLLLTIADTFPDTRSEASATALLFTNGGALAAYLARDLFDIGRSRVILMDFGGALGAAVGVGFGFLLFGKDNNSQLMAFSALAGMYGGLAGTYMVTENQDEFKRSADETSAALQLEGPTPTLVSSIDPKTGRQVMGFGLNLLNGTW